MTKEELEKNFRNDLDVLLKKYNADLKIVLDVNGQCYYIDVNATLAVTVNGYEQFVLLEEEH